MNLPPAISFRSLDPPSRRTRQRTAVLASLLLLFLPEAGWCQGYEILDLGTLGGAQSQALGLSDGGLVAGHSQDAGSDRRATLWVDGMAMDLGGPGGESLDVAQDVNDQGQACGYRQLNPQAFRAFRFDGSAWTLLPPLERHAEAIPYAIGPGGRVVGDSFNLGAGDDRAVLWEVGSPGSLPRDLGTLDGNSHARDINARGQVVGSSGVDVFQQGEPRRAFLWEEGQGLSALDPLPGEDYSGAEALNEVGDVVGSSWHFTAATVLDVPRATLWRQGRPIDLGRVPGPPSGPCTPGVPFWAVSVARDVNDAGLVVGEARCITSGGPQAAWVWRDGVISNLEDLACGSGWNLLTARAVNEAGEIAGFGIAPGGELRAFLAVPTEPVEEPSAVDVSPGVEPLRIQKAAGGPGLRLRWESLPSAEASTVFSGAVGDRTSHAAVACGVTGAETTLPLPREGSRYYLVASSACGGAVLSSLGRDSQGTERPVPTDPAERTCP